MNEKLAAQLLDVMAQEGPVTRPDLVAATGVPRTTIYDCLKGLIKQGIVGKMPLYSGLRQRGRPEVLFYITPRGFELLHEVDT